ncbi:MAG: hypothetical protein EU550_00510 [Promethearchaeota archaeon]|nr:MAG: hypothetical protein EU550_00510 [Candidatus Lokiarchaeota archaeon]
MNIENYSLLLLVISLLFAFSIIGVIFLIKKKQYKIHFSVGINLALLVFNVVVNFPVYNLIVLLLLLINLMYFLFYVLKLKIIEAKENVIFIESIHESSEDKKLTNSKNLINHKEGGSS